MSQFLIFITLYERLRKYLLTLNDCLSVKLNNMFVPKSEVSADKYVKTHTYGAQTHTHRHPRTGAEDGRTKKYYTLSVARDRIYQQQGASIHHSCFALSFHSSFGTSHSFPFPFPFPFSSPLLLCLGHKCYR